MGCDTRSAWHYTTAMPEPRPHQGALRCPIERPVLPVGSPNECRGARAPRAALVRPSSYENVLTRKLSAWGGNLS